MVSQSLHGLFSDLAARIDEEFERALSLRLARERNTLHRETVERFHQAARRFRQCETEQELYSLLLDFGAAFCGRLVLLEVRGGVLSFAGARGVEGAPPDTEVPLDAAPAVAAVVESADAVVALCSPGELSGTLAAFLGDAPRAYLLPLTRRGETVAVLCAAGGEVDAAALELFASLAGAALVTISGVAEPAVRAASAAWFALPREERRIHLRAQRFARVQAAGMRLHQQDAVRAGRESRDLYAVLRNEIDSAREAFRLQFFAPCPSMVDYLHLELVRTLTNGDDALLGPEYSGPLA